MRERTKKSKELNSLDMDSKWLSIQSFERNQSLIEDINQVILYFKLRLLGKPVRSGSCGEIDEAWAHVEKLIPKLIAFTKTDTKSAILGIDSRYRSFVRSFVEAQSRRTKFRSKLFDRDRADELLLQIKNPKTREDYEAIISSLSDLRIIVEDHNSLDLKELLQNI